MANEQNTELQDLSADELKATVNGAFEQYKTPIFAAVGGLVVLVLGLYWYTQIYSGPREADAQTQLYLANTEYQRDSLKLALNGNPNLGPNDKFIGYTGIISEYSGTDAANIAHYYAGATTLRMGQPQLAIDFLSEYSGEELMQTQAYSLMGDAYSELQKMDEAINYYNKAADNTDNDALSIAAKYKAARLLEYQDKKEEAKKYYQTIMDMDAQLAEAMGVDKDLLRLN